MSRERYRYLGVYGFGEKERGRDIERWMMGLLWVGVVRGLEYRNI